MGREGGAGTARPANQWCRAWRSWLTEANVKLNHAPPAVSTVRRSTWPSTSSARLSGTQQRGGNQGEENHQRTSATHTPRQRPQRTEQLSVREVTRRTDHRSRLPTHTRTLFTDYQTTDYRTSEPRHTLA